MAVPSWVQACCTAVKEAGVLPAASLATITPLCATEDPMLARLPDRSMEKFTLAGGVTITVVPGEDGPEELLLQAARQAVQAKTTGADSVPKKSLLSIILGFGVNRRVFLLGRRLYAAK